MIVLRTKNEKHLNDDKKRCESLKEKEKAKCFQSKIIQEALSNSSLNQSSSKKIIFSDDSGDDEKNKGNKSDIPNGKEKTVLFEDSSSEDENYEIKEKAQFGGKKGFKLLSLQCTYGNDERFKIDERFVEKDEEEEVKNNVNDGEDSDAGDEKVKQLKILESVLGEQIVSPEVEKKPKKRKFEMVRYDASIKDHEKYEIKNDSISSPSKKKKERKKIERILEEEHKPEVSKEKFYKISSEIKNTLKKKKEETEEFSLLQIYRGNESKQSDDEENKQSEEVHEFIDNENDYKYNDNKNNYEYYEERQENKKEEKEEVKPKKTKKYNKNVEEDKQSKVVEKPKVEKKGAVAKGIWKESFFFTHDDPRFNEGLEFINKKGSDEAAEAAENYGKVRTTVRQILRLHMKKQISLKNPFKNKVGGMNKKQLVNTKFKNYKSFPSKRKPFSSKRKPLKVNRRRKM